MAKISGWVRRRVWYSGQVQGVGFRQTVQQIAAGQPVVGSVRNLADCRVEVVAEGTAVALDAFLARIADDLARRIRAVEVEESPGTGEFQDFRIEY